jgi:hypothetical protein
VYKKQPKQKNKKEERPYYWFNLNEKITSFKITHNKKGT